MKFKSGDLIELRKDSRIGLSYWGYRTRIISADHIGYVVIRLRTGHHYSISTSYIKLVRKTIYEL